MTTPKRIESRTHVLGSCALVVLINCAAGQEANAEESKLLYNPCQKALQALLQDFVYDRDRELPPFLSKNVQIARPSPEASA